MRFLLTILLCLSLTTPVWAGASRDFDGASDRLNCGSAATLDNIFDGAGGTWAIWMRTERTDLSQRLIEKRGSGTINNFGPTLFFQQLNDQIDFYIDFNSNANPGRWRTPNNSILVNTWYHIAVTYDADLTTNDPIIYIDGVSQSLTEVSTPSGTRDTDASEVFLVGEDSVSAADFDGQLAYTHVYQGKILTGAEISQILFFPCSIADNLTACLPIHGVNSPEIDWSGSGNTGTVTGTTEVFLGPSIMVGGMPL